jgi:hypothetical protein
MSLKSITCAGLCLMALVMGVPLNGAADDYSEGWGTPTLIESNDHEGSYAPAVAVDGEGNAIAVWYRMDDTTVSVYYNRYEVGKGWLGEEELDDTDLMSMDPVVACDDRGDGLVVWSMYNESSFGYDLMSKSYDAEDGWGPVEMVNTEPAGYHASPDLAMDADGNAVVVWIHNDGITLQNVWGRLYEHGIGWGEAELLDDTDVETTQKARVEMDGAGRAVAVWKQGSGLTATLWSTRYDPASGWSAPEAMGTTVFNGYPTLAVADGGNATCTWANYNSGTSKYELWAANYVLGSGWGAQVGLYVSSFYSAWPTDVAVDRDGNAIVVSEWWGPTTNYNIFTYTYVAGVGWGPPSLPIATLSDVDAFGPKVSLDRDGDGQMIFGLQVPGTPTKVWAAACSLKTGWGIPTQIGPDLVASALSWDVVFDDAGNGMALILQSSGLTDDVWANRYTSADETPPTVSIATPADGTTVEQATVTVSGTTEPGVTLEVNGVLVAVDGNGGFSVELALLEGENEIMAVATDPAGNSATDSASVTFDDPQEDLTEDIQDELDVLQEELDQLYDVLDVVNDRLNDTWIDLTAAVGELEEVSSELNDTEDSLIDSQGELDDANGRIDSLTSLVTMLAAVTILLAALVVVMMLMHLRSRKGPGTPSVEERELPPPE